VRRERKSISISGSTEGHRACKVTYSTRYGRTTSKRFAICWASIPTKSNPLNRTPPEIRGVGRECGRASGADTRPSRPTVSRARMRPQRPRVRGLERWRRQRERRRTQKGRPSKSLRNFARYCANATAPSCLYPTNATPRPITKWAACASEPPLPIRAATRGSRAGSLRPRRGRTVHPLAERC